MANRTETIEEVEKIRKEVLIEKTYREELEKEVAGIPYSESVQLQEKSTEEELEGQLEGSDLMKDDETPSSIAQAMMPRKSRKLYEAMQIGKAKKRAEVELLKERKRKAEGKRTGKAGKLQNQ